MAKLRADKTRLQAGFVAIDPATGHIKAWVGSRDFKADQFDHVAQARRQPGSTFKVFVYGAALEQGMSPDKRFTDRAVEIPLPDGTVWRPADGAEPSGKRMTAREGLIYSKNTITAQVMQEVGAKKTADLARSMGVNRSKLDEVPALALGTSPVTPLEMVSAYSTVAAIGEYRQPVYITRITDRHGNVLAQFANENKQVMTEKTVGHLINMLRGAVDQGTGQAVRAQFGLRADVAGKTGTTQKNTDGWFVLMHPRLVAGAWVGFNDSRVTMRSNYWGEGAHNALLVVGDFFQHALAARLIDSRAEFPFARPQDSIWEPFFDAAREWFGGIFRDWLFGESAKPRRRNLQAEATRSQSVQREPSEQSQPTKEQLQEALRERREQIRQENRDRE
jgi:penicillin-binding protein 1A